MFVGAISYHLSNRQITPLLVESGGPPNGTTVAAAKQRSALFQWLAKCTGGHPDFIEQGLKLLFCFVGLQASYLTWGYMQELIMTTVFQPTANVPDGKFPSAAFCVFSNRFLAVIVALIAVRIKHGAFFANNAAPLQAFTPCALSNTMSSWSQYASLKYVSFPVQTVFKRYVCARVVFQSTVLFLCFAVSHNRQKFQDHSRYDHGTSFERNQLPFVTVR